MTKISTISLLCLLLTTLPAYGYFDPGTGSILIQVIVALMGMVVIFFRRIVLQIQKLRQKLTAFFYYHKPHRQHYLLAASIGIYVALFYSSHNIQELSPLAFILNICLFVIASLLLTVVCGVDLQKRQDNDKLVHGLLFCMGFYYMHIPILAMIKIFYIELWQAKPADFVIGIFVVILGAASFFIGKYLSPHTVKVLVVLAVMSILSAVKIAQGIYLNSSSSAEVVANLALDASDTVFYRQQNVYFLLFDAYTNSGGLEAIGLTASPELRQHLTKNKFTTYPQFYTNMQSTRQAISTYFSMDIRLGDKSIYAISLDRMQRISGGDNPVFSIFKRNGYATKIIMGNSTQFDLNAHMRNGYCFASLCMHKQSHFLSSYFSIFDKVVLNGMFSSAYAPPAYDYNRVNMRGLQRALRSQEQQFVYVHFMPPGHTVTTQGSCDEQHETAKYANRLSQANLLIAEAIDMLKQSDPQSLIILASDHGPFILNRCFYNAPLLSREQVLEKQGTFLAIHWGKDYDGRYDQDIKSSANLFRYVFAQLMGHEKLLQNKPDDDAFYQYQGEIVKTIDDGVILPPPADALKEE